MYKLTIQELRELVLLFRDFSYNNTDIQLDIELEKKLLLDGHTRTETKRNNKKLPG